MRFQMITWVHIAFEHVDVVSRVKCEHEYAPQCIKKTQQMIKTQMEIEVINQKYSQIKTETNFKTSIPTKNKFTQMKKKIEKKIPRYFGLAFVVL